MMIEKPKSDLKEQTIVRIVQIHCKNLLNASDTIEEGVSVHIQDTNGFSYAAVLIEVYTEDSDVIAGVGSIMFKKPQKTVWNHDIRYVFLQEFIKKVVHLILLGLVIPLGRVFFSSNLVNSCCLSIEVI